MRPLTTSRITVLTGDQSSFFEMITAGKSNSVVTRDAFTGESGHGRKKASLARWSAVTRAQESNARNLMRAPHASDHLLKTPGDS